MASEGAPLHICLLCMELFGFGSTGGFGRATRMIGRELAGRGHRVTIVTRQSPLSQDRRTDFMLDGVRVRMYSPRHPFSSLAIYRDCNADVYHSQDASLATWLAMRAMPEARHIYEKEKSVSFVETAMDAVRGADALVIMTEWKAFRSPDFDALKASLKSPVVFDGRNLYEPAVVRSHGLEYYPIGRGKDQAA